MKRRSPMTKPMRKPRQVGALGERLEQNHVLEGVTGRFERACRLRLGVDLRIALVAEQEEAVAARERGQPLEIGAVGDRALRIGRRREEHRDGARKQRGIERVEIGKKSALPGRRHVDDLAVGRVGACRIGRVERVRHQDRRPPGAVRDVALRGDRAEKQAFARAVEHEHLAVGIGDAGEAVAPRRPFRRRAAKLRGAFVARIAAELLDVGGDHGADEIGHRVLGLADAEIDRRLAGCDAGNELGKAHERGARVDDTSAREREPAFGAVHGHLHTRPHFGRLWKHKGAQVKARLTMPVKARGAPRKASKKEALACARASHDGEGSAG